MILHKDHIIFKDLLLSASLHLSIPLAFVEKDYWITLVLGRLATSQYVNYSVFKGGTSLSKGYNLIERFSEDVDGRSTRIWLDMMLKKHLKKCVDWSKIKKDNYMNAMIISTMDSSVLEQLIETALTNKINDREMFMKGIDYSYYYEE